MKTYIVSVLACILSIKLFGQGQYVENFRAHYPDSFRVEVTDTTAGLPGPVDYFWDHTKQVIYKTQDYGGHWQILNPRIHYHIPSPLSPYYKKVNDGILFAKYRRQLEPGNYTESEFFGGQKRVSLRFVNEKTGFLVYHHEIYRTDDGGHNWFYLCNLYQMSSQQVHDTYGRFTLKAGDLPKAHQQSIASRIHRLTEGKEKLDPDKVVNITFVEWVHDMYVLDDDFIVLVGEAPSPVYPLEGNWGGHSSVTSAWDSHHPFVLITKDGFRTLEKLSLLPPAPGVRRIDRAYFSNERWGELQYLDENGHWRTAYRTTDGGETWQVLVDESSPRNYGFIGR